MEENETDNELNPFEEEFDIEDVVNVGSTDDDDEEKQDKLLTDDDLREIIE